MRTSVESNVNAIVSKCEANMGKNQTETTHKTDRDMTTRMPARPRQQECQRDQSQSQPLLIRTDTHN